MASLIGNVILVGLTNGQERSPRPELIAAAIGDLRACIRLTLIARFGRIFFMSLWRRLEHPLQNLVASFLVFFFFGV